MGCSALLRRCWLVESAGMQLGNLFQHLLTYRLHFRAAQLLLIRVDYVTVLQSSP
jgi:hypothetical protein